MYTFLKSTNYLIFLSIVFFTIGNYLFNGWADGLVAIYFGTSAFLMYLLFVAEDNFYKNRSFFYYLAFCFFITLTLIKNEGLVLLLILFVTTFFMTLYKGEINKNIFKLTLLSFSFLPTVSDFMKIDDSGEIIDNNICVEDFTKNLIVSENVRKENQKNTRRYLRNIF